jgi:hypothetical protein
MSIARANVFRVVLEGGHRSMLSACLKGLGADIRQRCGQCYNSF